MISKSKEYENGYIFTPTSTDSDLQRILNQYKTIKCVLCNQKTSKNFRVEGGYFPLTINNRISDGVFFINNFKKESLNDKVRNG